jgi:hypothetical protein
VNSEHGRAMAHAAPVLSNYKTVHRRFQQWCEREVLREILTQLANTLREEGAIDERESFIDATFASAKGGGDGIGKTRRGNGVKMLAIVDRHGLPLSRTRPIIMRSRWCNSVLTSTCGRPNRSTSSVIARMTVMGWMTTSTTTA